MMRRDRVLVELALDRGFSVPMGVTVIRVGNRGRRGGGVRAPVARNPPSKESAPDSLPTEAAVMMGG